MARTNRFKPIREKDSNKKNSEFNKTKKREKIKLRELCKSY